MNSIWKSQVEMPEFESFEGNKKTDVLIIGGGMAGVLCAYFLHKAGVDYMLVEKDKIGSGVTQNTTAKITAQHRLIYSKLLKKAGQEKARLYFEANQDAVSTYFELCKNIECDLEKKTAYVYSVGDRRKLEEEADALYKIGVNTRFSEKTELPFQIAGAIGLENQAQFHPLKFIAEISKGLHIYENTFVKEFAGHKAVTEKGDITFQQAIVATHFPMNNKHGMYFLKMYQDRSYVIALENAKDMKGMYIDEDARGKSFMSYQNLLLLGGGSHRTGKDGGKWEELRRFARNYYPDAKEVSAWATQDCMTLDEIPYIGTYSNGLSCCYVATGFNKWGMSSSMAAAKLLTDLVLKKENEYTEIFLPSRSIWTSQLAVNSFEAAKGFVTISPKRCPHMGCALKWNPAERTWDCSCHGSRFDEKGKVKNNPANGNLS